MIYSQKWSFIPQSYKPAQTGQMRINSKPNRNGWRRKVWRRKRQSCLEDYSILRLSNFLFGGLLFTFYFVDYHLLYFSGGIAYLHINTSYPGFIMYCWQHVNWLKFSDGLLNVTTQDDLLGWFHHNDICWPILEPIVGLPGGADRKTGRQDQLCLFKVLVRQWLQLCQVPFGGIWFKTSSH